MSYRPITDSWILARPKVKYYGAYPAGFLERARVLLPVLRHEPVLHVCGGHAKEYPNWEVLCPNDVTCDLDPATAPDLVWDVQQRGIPGPGRFDGSGLVQWRGILADPPYTRDDAAKYAVGAAALPEPGHIVRDAMDVLALGGRVGLLHYVVPRPPKVGVKFVAKIDVWCGFGNRVRSFSVFEKR